MNIKNIKKGFTLVELLIVIGLLGAIALIVITAINPIEQANRARDTKFKSDASQVISAIERYYTQKSEFPWETNTPGSYASSDVAFTFASATIGDIGICGATCTADGLLITNDELKTEFRNRDFVKNNPALADQIRVGKAAGSSSSIYACFTPKSKSVRDKSCADGKVYTLLGSARSAVSGAGCAATAAAWGTGVNVVCLPE